MLSARVTTLSVAQCSSAPRQTNWGPTCSNGEELSHDVHVHVPESPLPSTTNSMEIKPDPVPAPISTSTHVIDASLSQQPVLVNTPVIDAIVTVDPAPKETEVSPSSLLPHADTALGDNGYHTMLRRYITQNSVDASQVIHVCALFCYFRFYGIFYSQVCGAIGVSHVIFISL
jgi:hypothetical protein